MTETKKTFDGAKFAKGLAWLVIPLALTGIAAWLDTVKAPQWTALIGSAAVILRAVVDYLKHNAPTTG